MFSEDPYKTIFDYEQKLYYLNQLLQDIKMPLTVMKAEGEMIMSKYPLAAEVDNKVRTIVRNAQCIQDLLMMNDQADKYYRLQVSPIVIKPVIERSVKRLQAQLIFNQVTLNNYFSELENQVGWIDGAKVEKIIWILSTYLLSAHLENKDRQGAINLDISVVGDSLNFSFKVEQGEWIAINEDLFSRNIIPGKNTAPENLYEGISLANYLIEIHHGHIKSEESSGKHHTFTVRIPIGEAAYGDEEKLNIKSYVNNVESEQNNGAGLKPAKIVLPDPSTREHSSKSTSSPVLLIVDDEEEIRNLLTEIFSDSDYAILLASNGKEALEQIKLHEPSLILSDYVMPVMDGVELCDAIKNNEKTSHIPVILLTQYQSIKTRIESLENGADDYIEKPFNYQELLLRVKNIIESRKRLQDWWKKGGILDESSPLPEHEKEFLQKAMEVVRKNFENDDFKVNHFADEMAMSKAKLTRKLNALLKRPPSNFILDIKMKEAWKRLKAGAESVSQVAFDFGFKDPRYFSRVFKEYYGIGPKKFMDSFKDERTLNDTDDLE